jgi:long-chain acyl-CoA synthetase
MHTKPKRFVADSLIVSGTHYPDKIAVVVEGQPYRYGDLLEHARRLASALLDRGLQRGDRVAIYMDNTWPCIISIYAVAMTGAVFLVINPQTKADKLAYILNDSEAGILLTDLHLKAVINDAVPTCQTLTHVICSGKQNTVQQDLASLTLPVEYFDEVIANAAPLTQPAHITPVDLAALIYTSGSTGNPKGVMHTHQSMTFALGSLIEYLRLSHDHVLLNVLPFAFDYGLYQLLMAIELGATLVLERSFTYPAQVFKRIEEYQVSVFPGVPTIFSMLLAAHARTPLAFPSIERVTNTAAALPADYVPKLKQIFPGALIYKMYGLTECKRVSYLEPELVDTHADSVGKAIPGTEVFLLSEQGQAVAPGEHGILHVRGPHLMLGYWKQPDLSAHMLKPGQLPHERVLCTHDWFRMDEDGFLYFVGRSDDIIKTRGEKVSPIEVENVLHGIDGVIEAAVIGWPDDLLGEKICAFVALAENSGLTDKQIRKICLNHLENFMAPQEIIILDSLPKTATGKISKKLLKEHYATP